MVTEILLCLIIGIPALALLFNLLDYYDVYNMQRKKRWIMSVLVNLIMAPLFGFHIYYGKYHKDRTFEYTMKNYGISIPMYYATDASFPEELNMGDDFGIDKTLKLMFGFSDKEVSKLDELARKDQNWVKTDSVYLYIKDDLNNGVNIRVKVDVSGKCVETRYHCW